MAKEVYKYINIDILPKFKEGRYKNKINWKASIGMKVDFIYDDIEGEFTILENDGENVLIQYLDNPPFKIKKYNLRELKIGKYLGKTTNEFKIEIGQEYTGRYGTIKIIDKFNRKMPNGQIRKYYKYKCLKCGDEDIVEESSLINSKKTCSCKVCSSQKVLQGYNDIYTTDKWMIDLGVSEEDAKKYTRCSTQKIKVTCPHCGKILEKPIYTIYKTKSIACTCSDNIPFGEKYIISLLLQLKMDYTKEYSPLWIDKKRYDFYFKIGDEEYIVETHGEQHYKEANGFKKTLKEVQDNDIYKREMAIKNGIKEENYIVLNCKKSEFGWVKDSILNSKLNDIFDLSDVNWEKCGQYVLGNQIKEICDYYQFHKNIKGEHLPYVKMAEIFKVSNAYIGICIKQGKDLGWVDK